MDFSRNTCLSLSFITLSFSFLFSARLIALPKANDYKLNSEFIDSVIQNIKNTNQKLIPSNMSSEEPSAKLIKTDLVKIHTHVKAKKHKKVIISHTKSSKDKSHRSKIKVKAAKNLKIISQEQNTIFLNPKPISEPLEIKIENEFPVLRRPSQM